ncbi:MAG: CRISPR-associated endoribonuclease Cas6, partial [Candidatus Thorarchaeota archaeon]|nr:CRISPR-associated endoribonuclease Cas6 [Candidatus Thorarchaeota archaeon]
MRFRATLAPIPTRDRPLLRYDYQYEIGAMIYKTLRNDQPDVADQLHESRRYKPYTFSRLEIPRRRTTKLGIRILCNDTYLWFSSPIRELCFAVANSLMNRLELSFSGLDFRIVNIQMLDDSTKVNNGGRFTTLSPVILRTMKETGESSKTWDLSPTDDKFKPNLRSNILKRYRSFTGKEPSEDLEVGEIDNIHQKRIWIKDTSHRAYM